VFNTLYLQLLGFSGGRRGCRFIEGCLADQACCMGRLLLGSRGAAAKHSTCGRRLVKLLVPVPCHMAAQQSVLICRLPPCRLPGFAGGCPVPGRHRFWSPGVSLRAVLCCTSRGMPGWCATQQCTTLHATSDKSGGFETKVGVGAGKRFLMSSLPLSWAASLVTGPPAATPTMVVWLWPRCRWGWACPSPWPCSR